MFTLTKSKINTYIQCPEKYRLQYLLRIRPLRTNTAIVEGQALHRLIEAGLLYDENAEDVLPAVSEEFWKSMPFEFCAYDDLSAYEAASTRCLLEAKAFLKMLGHLEVRATERDIEAPLVDPISGEACEDINLRGIIDLVDTIDGIDRIIDLKTVSRSPTMPVAHLSMELSIYGYLATYPNFLDRIEPVPVALVSLVRTKAPKVIWDESFRTVEDFEQVTRTCRQIAQAISLGHFWKNPGVQCAWCAYAGFCQYDRDRVVRDFGLERWEFYQSIKAQVETTLTPGFSPLATAA
ncbi:MAG: PD-(D/E)XK nuclease family protein [Solidesulfovibrio sp.]|uniref:PD-(D/E)XK nuclease family protein n=1 Tax=Solidesulfovibrio sp. TaxID=2910990 RepID=UPI00315907AC